MTREEYASIFNGGLPEEKKHWSINAGVLIRFEKSKFNNNGFQKIVADNNYYNQSQIREAVLRFVQSNPTRRQIKQLRYGFSVNSAPIIEKSEPVNFEILKSVTNNKTTNSRGVILDETIDGNRKKQIIAKISRKDKTNFTIHELLGDVLNLDTTNWKEESDYVNFRGSVIDLVHKYGPNIVPYNFLLPIDQRMDYFHTTREWVSLFKKYYNNKAGIKNSRLMVKPTERSIISKLLPADFPRFPEKLARDKIISGIGWDKIKLYFSHSKRKFEVIPVEQVAPDLLSLLYVYLEAEDLKEYKFNRCKRCKRWFLPGRKNQIFCSLRCLGRYKQKTYYARHH